MIKYDRENERLADTSPCHGIRADLKMCLLESDCCRVDKKTPRQCLKEGLAPDCDKLRTTFFECKRSITTELDFVAAKDTKIWNRLRPL